MVESVVIQQGYIIPGRYHPLLKAVEVVDILGPAAFQDPGGVMVDLMQADGFGHGRRWPFHARYETSSSVWYVR